MVVVARVGGRADGWALLLKQAWVHWVGLSVGWVVSRLPWVNFQELGAGKKERKDRGKDRICAVGERLAATWRGADLGSQLT